MMANPNQLKTTNARAHMHKTVLRERSTLNQGTLIGFLSGKEENIQVLKHVFSPGYSETPSSEP